MKYNKVKKKKDILKMKNSSFIINYIKEDKSKLKIYSLVDEYFNEDNFCFLDKYNNEVAGFFYDYKYDSSKKVYFIELDIVSDQLYYPTLKLENEYFPLKINFASYAKLNNIFYPAYLKNDKYLIKVENNCFHICKNKPMYKLKYDLQCALYLLRNKNFKCFFIRSLSNFLSFFKSREIWIISDGVDNNCENGEDFFKYVIENKLNPDIKYYFAVDKKCDKFKFLNEEYSNIININSFRYKMLVLYSDYIFSSSLDNNIFDPFSEKDRYFISDMYSYKFIYLHNKNLTKIKDIPLFVDRVFLNDEKSFNKISKNDLFCNVILITPSENNENMKYIYDEINK